MQTIERIKFLINHLQLAPHPEGGYYQETYRSDSTIDKTGLPDNFSGDRSFLTTIFYLLDQQNFSAFHQIQSDEAWHFYEGCGLYVHEIKKNGELISHRLGSKIEQGEKFQLVIPAGSWFASEPIDKESYALVGCSVAPGFDFADFELATTSHLSNLFPQHKDLIVRLTR